MVLGDLESSLEADEGQLQLLPDTQPKQLAVDFSDRHGYVNKAKLLEEFARLQLVEAIAERHAAAALGSGVRRSARRRGGFDLIVGNPPWLKVEWEEKGIIGDADPMVLIRKVSASELAKRAQRGVCGSSCSAGGLPGGVRGAGRQPGLSQCGGELSAAQGQPDQPLQVLSAPGLAGGLRAGGAGFPASGGRVRRPEGGALREVLYGRLRNHFQFQNEFNLFSRLASRVKFSLNIYGQSAAKLHPSGQSVSRPKQWMLLQLTMAWLGWRHQE